MSPMLEILSGFMLTGKLYEEHFSEIRRKYQMTQMEVDILTFLHNNAPLDTASDIVRWRMLPKASVSQAVELLIRKKLVQRRPDEKDRRRIHLAMLPEAKPLLDEILNAQEEFWDIIFAGVEEEERERFWKMSRRISDNVKKGLEKNGAKNGTEK